MQTRTDIICKFPHLIELWKGCGSLAIFLGLESVTDEGLALVNKKNTAANNERAIAILKELGVGFTPNFIVDPAWDHDDFARLREWISRTGAYNSGFSVLTPLPGTDLWSEAKDRVTTDDWEMFDIIHAVLPTKLPLEEFYREYSSLWRHVLEVRYELRGKTRTYLQLGAALATGKVSLGSVRRGMNLAKVFSRPETFLAAHAAKAGSPACPDPRDDALDDPVAAAVDRDLRAGGLGEEVGRESRGELADVTGADLAAEEIAPLVLLDRETVARGTLREHLGGPQVGIEDGVRMKNVDPDAARRELEGGDAGELDERRLRGRVGRRSGAGREDIARADDDHRGAERRQGEERHRGAQQAEVGFDVDLESAPPEPVRQVLDLFAGGEEAEVQHQHVEPAEALDGEIQGAAQGRLVGGVALDRQEIRTVESERLAVEAGDGSPPPAQGFEAGTSDAARRAGDQRHPAAELRRRHCGLQLGLFELPVLDFEELALRQRTIAAQGLRRLHRGEGVARDGERRGGGARRVAETDDAASRKERDARREVEPLQGAIATVGGEVGRVVVPVLRDRRRRGPGIGQAERPRFGAQRMVGGERSARGGAPEPGVADGLACVVGWHPGAR